MYLLYLAEPLTNQDKYFGPPMVSVLGKEVPLYTALMKVHRSAVLFIATLAMAKYTVRDTHKGAAERSCTTSTLLFFHANHVYHAWHGGSNL